MTKLEKNATKLVKTFHKAGFQALFAGGYVRDKILKRSIHDIDIATNAGPEEIKKILDKNKIKHIEIGEKFGVIAAVMPKELKVSRLLSARLKTSRSGQKSEKSHVFEIATFREEFGSEDFRRPKKVRFDVTPEEDATRRDFTINGMFLDIKNENLKTNSYGMSSLYTVTKKYKWGTVTDYVGGLEDLKNKIIRFIGDPDERIKEDALRMIRAVRFSAQINFEIEEKSYKAILKNKHLIEKISAERVRDELNKILVSNNPRMGIELLDDLGFIKILIPELIKGKNTPQPKNEHLEGSVWNHTLLALDKISLRPSHPRKKEEDPIFCWAVLMHDVGKPYTIQTPEEHGTDRIRFSGHDNEGAKIAKRIMRRLKFSNSEMNKVAWLVKYHMIFSNFFKMREAKRIRYLTHPYFEDLLELFWVDANSSVRSDRYGNPLPPELSAYKRAKKILEKEKTKPKLPKPVIRGNDVMKIMGIEKGNNKVGEILRKVYDEQLENKFKTKKEGLILIKKLLKKKR